MYHAFINILNNLNFTNYNRIYKYVKNIAIPGLYYSFRLKAKYCGI